MRVITLLLVIKLAAGQLSLHNDVELVPAMANMAQITSLDVQCEKSGMTVNVAFSQPFNGIIFSKGHFSNPACRYVRANSGQDSYTFIIPMMDCGTRAFDNNDDGSTGFENMIMIQHEAVVQEIWDTARKITCDWTTRMEKLITFRPFAVDMLPAKNVRYSGDDVMCWMDIQLGKGPFSNTVDGIVKIGEELTIVIYSKDEGSEFDMLVKNCFAYDSEDLEDERTTRLQLSDDRGCLLKPKLMSYFFRTRETGATGADIIAYASLFAFKFPDKMDVYLSCEVELCKGGCTGMCDDPGFPSNLIARLASTSTTTTTRPPPVIDPCVTQPGLSQCCSRNPSHLSCTSTTTARFDPCDRNPGLPQCCARNPDAPQCTTTSPSTTARSTTTTRLNPCLRNPRSRECCVTRPNSPFCRTMTRQITTSTSTTTARPNRCLLDPRSRECCATRPNSPLCTATTRQTTRRPSTTRFNPCVRNPRSRQCCAINPNAPQCTTTTRPITTTFRTTVRPPTSPRIDPCILNPKSRQCCIRNPSSVQCTTTTTPRPNPCDINPLLLQCCTINPNLPHCTSTTQRTTTTRQTTTTRGTTTTPQTTTSRRATTTPRTTTTRRTTTPQTTTTRRPTTTSRITTTRRTTTPRTTTTRRTTTPRTTTTRRTTTTPQTTTTRRSTTTRRTTTTPRITTTQRTSITTRRTTTPLSDPCALNPGATICCARNPFSPECVTTRPTTPRPGLCDLNPRSPQCCAINPNSPQCITTTPRTTITSTTVRPTTRRSITTTGTSTTTSQPTTTRRPITTRPTTTTRRPITRKITTTQRPTTTKSPDPCDLNPQSTKCCARNPNSPGCARPTSERLILSTTSQPDPCINNPGSSRCCSVNPKHPQCSTEAPCSGPNDTRPKCRSTTQAPSTPRNLEFHAFHKWQSGPPTSQRRRRPPYGTRLSADVLSELSNTPRRRRDVALPPPPPPPPPPRNTVSMIRGFRVVGANDLTFRAVSFHPHAAAVVDNVCVPTATFAIGLLMLSLLLITAVLVATFSCLRLRSLTPSKAVEAKNPYYKQ